jgi:putative endonuclease
MADSHILGQKGEDIAAGHLVEKGYRILHRNWKSGKRELDIVAENNDFIVFVEVKTRTDDYSIHPRQAVTSEKQRSIIYAAEGYIQKYNINKEGRFDIVAVISDGQSVVVEHIENAFYPTLR